MQTQLEQYQDLLKIRLAGTRRQAWIFTVLVFLLWAAYVWLDPYQDLGSGEVIGQLINGIVAMAIVAGTLSKWIEVKTIEGTLELLEVLGRQTAA